jgi:N-glycosylase/DNA lyase
MPDTLVRLRELHAERKPVIESRLAQFRALWDSGTEEELFEELVFCLLTPQSRARACWAAVEDLRTKGLLMRGDAAALSAALNCVRFRNNKARYILEARKTFAPGGRVRVRPVLERSAAPEKVRAWLVDNVKGMGFKEASHFLRNVGLGEGLAILDRHILKNLVALGVIDSVPRSLGPKTYLDIEARMRSFSKEIGIPLACLDLLLWCKETGEIFK